MHRAIWREIFFHLPIIFTRKFRPVTSDDLDRKRMAIALVANLVMFFIGLVGWQYAKSTGLLADAFDMLADASGYIVALLAIGRSEKFKINAARWNGLMLIVLGLGVVGEAIHRFIVGSEPLGLFIIGFATLSLVVNGAVLMMLSRYQHTDEMHLKATWRDTRADVLVNLGVLLSGAAIAVTGYGVIDPIVGLAIGAYVIKEGVEIWAEADD